MKQKRPDHSSSEGKEKSESVQSKSEKLSHEPRSWAARNNLASFTGAVFTVEGMETRGS